MDEDITLEHTFFPKLFSQMRLNLGGMDVEIINNPGDVSSLLCFILCDENVKNTYGELMGWIPDNKKVILTMVVSRYARSCTTERRSLVVILNCDICLVFFKAMTEYHIFSVLRLVLTEMLIMIRRYYLVKRKWLMHLLKLNWF